MAKRSRKHILIHSNSLKKAVNNKAVILSQKLAFDEFFDAFFNSDASEIKCFDNSNSDKSYTIDFESEEGKNSHFVQSTIQYNNYCCHGN